ncbi:Insertion element protein [Kineococcus glutinatus]|uniref:Insertion element protein n=1 Tax=Kineococcus glutinatus TaxID=1070872 RepID=A0ABP9HV52_9ACTN
MSEEGGRSTPLHCPFCAGEQLYPDEASPTAWRCAECLRIFAVRFLGVAPVPRGGSS